MIRRPPRSTRTDTLFPYTTLFRSRKHELIKAQHPGLDIRFVFSRSKSPIRKGSKTTYADWCAKRGIPFADKLVPQEWAEEPNDPARHEALRSEEHTSELQSLMRISYAVFCLKKNKKRTSNNAS